MTYAIKLAKPLILASKSPRRAQLFEQIGLEFRVIVSDIPESIEKNFKPEEQAVVLSLLKAQHVAKNLDQGIVVGADTIVALNGKILGKPVNRDEAFMMLRYLSGKTHKVFTGFSIVDVVSKKYISDFECTEVTFRHLSDNEIEEYIQLDHSFDKAGAYGTQDRSALFVEKIDGCYYNVVGFPLAKFYLQLKKFLKLMDDS